MLFLFTFRNHVTKISTWGCWSQQTGHGNSNSLKRRATWSLTDHTGGKELAPYARRSSVGPKKDDEISFIWYHRVELGKTSNMCARASTVSFPTWSAAKSQDFNAKPTDSQNSETTQVCAKCAGLLIEKLHLGSLILPFE